METARRDERMIPAYDVLTGFQIIMAGILFTYACYFQRPRNCMPFVIVIPYIVFLLWGIGIIYYFAVFFALAVLWFLLGGLFGAGISVYFRRRFPLMQVLEDGYMIQCPPLLLAPVILVAAVLLFGGIQFAAYVFPFFSQSWIFNEMIGFIPGMELSQQCDVSRQIIVGDVAILRAEGLGIVSTPRGYQLIGDILPGVQHVFVCCHDMELMQAELEAIVDNGGVVHNVVIEHEVYGNLEGTLNLRSRRDVKQYVKKMKDSQAELLSRISGGIHTHLVTAACQEDIDAIQEALESLGVLYT